MEASITLDLLNNQPNKVVLCLLNSGWRYVIDGKINVIIEENDDFNFITFPEKDFSIDFFFNLVKSANKFGMTIINEENIGGEFLVEDNMFTFMPTLHRQYVNEKHRIIDFSWYLNKFTILYEEFTVLNTQCCSYI